MCGLFNDAADFITSSVKEIASHPLEAAGAALGVPGFDPAIGGFFNSGNALISPTGNFTTGAWNDMFNASPGNSGLGLFSGVNQVADKVAPALAGGFAAGGGLGSALSSTGTDAASGLGGTAFTTGLEGAGSSTLGGLEGSLGGAGLFGASAGTGTAIGSGVAQGLGAGGLGIAGGDALGGTVGTTFGSALGASPTGTGLGTSATLPAGADSGAVSVGGGAVSPEGSQAAPGAFQNGASMPGQGLGPSGFEGAGPGGGEQGGGNLSALYGPNPSDANTLSAGSSAGQVLGQSTGGISPALTSTAKAATGNMDPTLFQNLGSLFKLANSGVNAWQQLQQGHAQSNYANSIKDIFSPTGAYANQMAQTLARQDAAAGRNSQYGTRSVQLAAALAQAQANALGNSNYARAATATPNMNALNGLFANFSSPQAMQGLYNLGSAGFNGLSNLFSGF
jgi:hypothetical protein